MSRPPSETETATSPAAIIAAAGFRKISSQVEEMTPELAKRFAEMDSAHTERLRNPKRTKHLRQRVLNGLAVTFHWVEAYIKGLEEARIRINGNHSSNLLSTWDGQLPSGLTVIHEVYECDTQEDVAELHQQFDVRWSSRSVADIAKVYQGLVPAVRDLDPVYAKLAIDGYLWFMRKVEHDNSAPGGDQAYTLFQQDTLHSYIQWLANLHTSKTREMQEKPVAAAMFVTLKANEAEARAFWALVARGGDPDQPELPATALDDWLRATREGTNVEECENIKPEEIYQACVYCWNAHRDGKTVSTVRYEVKKNFAIVKK